MPTQEQRTSPRTVVELKGRIAGDLVPYLQDKIETVLGHTALPIPHVNVRVTRYDDPARSRPVSARANVDLNGRLLRVETDASTPREAADMLVHRLRIRLGRLGAGWRYRYSHLDSATVAAPSPSAASPEPAGTPEPEHPEVIRHWTVGTSPASVDEAVADMADLGQDFHLFLERSRNVDSVVYRSGPTGLRLTQLDGRADLVPCGRVPFTSSTTVPPMLDTPGAIERLRATGLPFVFYLDGDHDRACVLYRRADGHYGLVDALDTVLDESTADL